MARKIKLDNVSFSHLQVGDVILASKDWPMTVNGTVTYTNGDPHICNLRIEGSVSINPGGKLDMHIAYGRFYVERSL